MTLQRDCLGFLSNIFKYVLKKAALLYRGLELVILLFLYLQPVDHFGLNIISVKLNFLFLVFKPNSEAILVGT